MKQKLLLFLTLFTLATGTLWAYDFSAPNADGVEIYYNILNDANTVKVTKSETGFYTGSVNIPSTVLRNGKEYTVISIGDYAFYKCSGLTSITIPNTVTSIDNYTFYECSSLTSITIPNSVTSIGDGIFSCCSGLTAFYGKYASEDNRCLIDNGRLIAFAPAGLTEYTIPNSVTTIGDQGFYSCFGLTSVTIPNSVTTIDYHAFAHCTGLTTVTIPNSVTSIGNRAFAGCTGLTYITIPGSVSFISIEAFLSCTALQSINVEWATPDKIVLGSNIFWDVNTQNCDLFVPVGTKSLYEAVEPWNTFNIIEDEPPVSGNFSAPNADGVMIYYHILEDGKTVEVIKSESGSYTGSVNIPSTVIRNGKEYTVTAIGVQAFYCCTGLTSVTIPNSVTSIGVQAFDYCTGLTSVTIPNSVTSIGENAFINCSGLTSITIPNSVTSIGDGAFCQCSGLTSITIPNSVTTIGSYAFYYCSGLTSVTIPPSVTTIGSYAFAACTGLTTVAIPNSVTTIGDWAFAYCTGLTSITISNSVTSIGENAFNNCSGLTSITIPPSVTTIGYGAFAYCTGLTSVTIPNSVTSIGEFAFRCDGLTAFYGDYASEDNRCLIIDGTLVAFAPAGITEYTIPTSVTTIGSSAFAFCTALNTVTIPTTVTIIGRSAFNHCTGLTTVTIPNSVTTIGDWAFASCTGLTSITISNSVTTIGYYAFYYCSGLTSITIPTSVTTIGLGAFVSCSGMTAFYGKYASDDNRYLIIDGTLVAFAPAGLTEYTIPSTVTSIGASAFSECSELTSVNIPTTVTSIGLGAFASCSGLISITIPSSVTSIGESAFNSCSALTYVKVEWTDPQEVTIADNAFVNVNTQICTLFVPVGTKSLYEAVALWNTFNIVEDDPAWAHELPEDVYARLEGTYTCQGDDKTFTLFISIFPESDARYLKKAVIYGWGGYDWAKIECSLDYNATTGQVQLSIPEGSVIAHDISFAGLGSCNVYALGYSSDGLTLSGRITVLSNADQSEFTFQKGIAGGIFKGDASSANFTGYVWFRYLSLVMKKQLDSIDEIATIPTDEPTVTTTGGELQIHNTLPGQPVALYTLTGQMLYSGVTTDTLTTVPLTLPKGTVCILKVGTHTRKLIL